MKNLLNLNVFLTCYAFIASFSSGFIFILVAFYHVSPYLLPILYLIPALPLILILYKYGLSPSIIKEGGKIRFNIGHWLLGIVNISAMLIVVLPIIISEISGNREVMGALWLLVPIIVVGAPLAVVGLVLVWSSRA